MGTTLEGRRKKLPCCLGLGQDLGCPRDRAASERLWAGKADERLQGFLGRQDFLLTQLGEVHLLRIPIKSAPAGKALRDLCVCPPCSEKEREARKKRLAPVDDQSAVVPNANLSIPR